MDLKNQIKKMIIKELNLVDIELEDIGDNDPLFGDKFGLDSIDAVELVFQIKTYFGVEIRDMKQGRPALQTIKTLSEYIETKMV
ncbi:phosphopantetheine-binding protein [Desulfobacterales bacterium HSG17]|nr:phosphopantetheine-binding protein [Desulfobacterales bacterium HSG17]